MRWALMLVLCGCNQLLGVHELEYQDASASGDVLVDTAVDVPDGPPPPCNLTAPFGPPVAVAELNTSAAADAVTEISRDGNTLYMTSSRVSGDGSQLYTATWNVGTQMWNAPTLAYAAAAPNDVYSLTLAPGELRGLTAETRAGTQHIYSTTRTTTTGPFTLGGIVTALSSAQLDATPHLSRDGTRVYFDSERDSVGDRDLFQVDVVDLAAGTFGTVTKMTTINSTALEAGPVVSPDQLTIYFTSLRDAPNSGQVYFATRTNKSLPFGSPLAMPNVNTTEFEGAGAVSPDGCAFYVNRLIGGFFDIYVARRPAI